ncbi:MAG: HAD family hydrolase, partial [Candidatus Omnitrophota bacterium]
MNRLIEKRRTAEDNDLLIEVYEEMRKGKNQKQTKLLRGLIAKWEGERLPFDFVFGLVKDARSSSDCEYDIESLIDQLKGQKRTTEDVRQLVEEYRKSKNHSFKKFLRELAVEWQGKPLPIDFVGEILEDEWAAKENLWRSGVVIDDLERDNSVLLKGRTIGELESLIEKLLKLGKETKSSWDDRKLNRIILKIIEKRGSELSRPLLESLAKHKDYWLSRAAKGELKKREKPSTNFPAFTILASSPEIPLWGRVLFCAAVILAYILYAHGEEILHWIKVKLKLRKYKRSGVLQFDDIARVTIGEEDEGPVDRVLERFKAGPTQFEIEAIHPNPPPQNKPVVAVFDVHGTLLEPTWKKEYRRAYKELIGKHPSEEWMNENVINRTKEESVTALCRLSGKTPKEIKTLLKETRSKMEQEAPPKAIPGALELVEALHERGVPIVIISGSTKDRIVPHLEKAGFLEYVPEENIIDRGTKARKDYNRAEVLEGVRDQYPGHTVAYFDDWLEATEKIKDWAICFGVPQGEGEEFKYNRQKLVEAGVHYIIRGEYYWEVLVKLLTVPTLGAPVGKTILSDRLIKWQDIDEHEEKLKEVIAREKGRVAFYVHTGGKYVGYMEDGSFKPIYPNADVYLENIKRALKEEKGVVFILGGSFELLKDIDT